MIAGIVLAAGRSLRMGEPKALLVFAGATFLRRAVEALRDGGCGQVIVVTGAPADPAAASIAAQARELDAEVEINGAAQSEQVDSLRVGLRAVADDADAVVVLPVDVPAVDAQAVRAVIGAFRSRGAPVVRAAYGGRNGHPVLFARALFAELLGDDLPDGARTVIHRHAAAAESVAVTDAGILVDVDTPDDYRRLLADTDDAAAQSPSRNASDNGVAAHGRLAAAEAVRLAHAALAGGEAVASVVVVRAAPDAEAAVGTRMAVFADRVLGTLGSDACDAEAVDAARDVLAGRADAGVRELGGGALSAFVEAHRGQAELVIVGAGHIARPLCRVGALLGFRVTVIDDRPDFATRERFPEAERVIRGDFAEPLRGVETGPGTWLVLATRGHKHDYDALRDALRRPQAPAYVGMVGSRRRTRAAIQQLLADGVAPERLRRVHAPIGLDVGAETPEEIAVAIAAELVQVRRGGTGQPLADRARVVERTLRSVECAPQAGPDPARPHPSQTTPP